MHSENKELVRAGRAFADALSHETSIVDVEKMIYRLVGKLDMTNAAVTQALKERDALAAENAQLKSTLKFAVPWLPTCDDELSHRIELAENNPATDAAIAEMQAQYRAEGINFAASRLCAAYNNGFIDKPLEEIADVVGMILAAKEDITQYPAADGLSGEYAEKSLEAFAAQLHKEAGK